MLLCSFAGRCTFNMSFFELGASAGSAGVAAAMAVNAALMPQSQLFGRTIVAGRNPREIALTYDDGPNDRSTQELLDALDGFGAKATFFMIGRFVSKRPDLARRVHEAGHLVGNHTMTHPWLAWQPLRRIQDELRGCNEAIEDAIGAPVRYFRPPHGARRPAVLRAARALGLSTVQWNAMGNDWEPVPGERIVERVEADVERARRAGTGSNILLHDGYELGLGADRTQTVRATKILIERFRLHGDTFVTVDKWL